MSLAPDLLAAVAATLEEWQAAGKIGRLWARDPTLWTDGDEARWLGWLDVVPRQLEQAPALAGLASELGREGFTDALLLGMGGSSLGPEVLERTFGRVPGRPRLHVLDSTDPAQVRSFESRVDLARTLVVVSSKSGSTLEPNILKAYFWERVSRVVKPENAGAHFVAITDPDSQLHREAAGQGFRRIFFGEPGIGGRYSVLSAFGMVPAAILGVDVARLLAGAEEMAAACAPSETVERNPGVVLGAVLGTLGRAGLNKVTIVASPPVVALGAWLEQLLAESTGKSGRGLVPVDREPLGGPDVYGSDRLFVYVRHTCGVDGTQDEAVEALRQAGRPVVEIAVDDAYDLGREFFRWEIATAVAGSILGIHPFDQPDVEASKVATRELTDAYERTGSLPLETPLLEEDSLALFADASYAASGLGMAAGGDATLARCLRAHLAGLTPGDYFAVLAYIEMNEAHESELKQLRRIVRDTRRVATCVGFGPRFLHSTGQVYKGGPDTGVFLQVTCDDPVDLPVPGRSYTFGVVKAAQARGDFAVLVERGRRALRVHLKGDATEGLRALTRVVATAAA